MPRGHPWPARTGPDLYAGSVDTNSPAPDLRHVGRSGLVVSVVGLGCNNLGRTGTATSTPEGAAAVVGAALDCGITFFDTADCYGARPGLSEELLGRALSGHRDEAVIATKFGMDLHGADGPDFGARGSRSYVVRAVEASLRRLGTDHIDLYQFHTPDPSTPIEETLAALDDVVRAGKVRHIGHSNRSGWQIAQAEYVARELGTHRFVSAQNHYNLIDRRAELEVLPAAHEFGLGVLPYFPLANGLLTGKYSRDTEPPSGSRLDVSKRNLLETAPWDALDGFRDLAQQAGMTPLRLAFSWLASHPTIPSVIAGATRPDQVRQNAASVVSLSDDVLARLDEIFPPAQRVALF